MAAAVSMPGFRFDLIELLRPAPSRTGSATAARVELPPGAEPVLAGACPRWLPRLLPVFRGDEPLRLEVVGSAAPSFAAVLGSALAALFALAGQDSGLEVLAWDGGVAVGAPGLSMLPARPHAVLVTADLIRESAAPACRMAASQADGRGWLVMHGDLPRLDQSLQVDAPALAGRVARLPLLGPAELQANARGAESVAASRRFGESLLALAAALTTAYRELVGCEWP